MKPANLPARCTICVMLIAGALHGCVSTPDLRADYDHAADFSKYRTFDFVPQPSTAKAGYSTLLTQQLSTAVRTEMEKRGYTLQSANPDLLVNFSANLREKQEIRSSPSTGYYGYRYYGAWPGYSVGGDVYTVDYKEGTLNVDLIDASNMQMVWEGVAVGEVTRKHMEDREAAVNKAVEHVFAKYPFRAGDGQPIQTASQ